MIYGLIIAVCKDEDHCFRISILISEKIYIKKFIIFKSLFKKCIRQVHCTCYRLDRTNDSNTGQLFHLKKKNVRFIFEVDGITGS